MGWGSGTANFPYLITPEMALNNYILTQTTTASVQTVCDNYAQSQIQSLATTSTAALVFINAQAGEGFIDVDGNVGDRRNLSAWHDADRLIENVTTYNNNTVCSRPDLDECCTDFSRLS
jgi:beta-glucosidase